MNVAYFAHELADAAVRRRVAMMRSGGGAVTLLGFARERGAGATKAGEGVVLGVTHNQRLAHRLLAVLGALPKAWSAQASWRHADVLIARNLEMLALAWALAVFSRAKGRLIYECLDIHRLMSAPGLVGAGLRLVERTLLRRVAAVVTSSPAFVDRHFRAKQRYAGEIILAENKLLARGGDALEATRRPGPPWKIAWCGVLRCRRSLTVLDQLTRAHGGQVEVHLWGKPAHDQLPDFEAVVADNPQLHFHGQYEPDEVGAIYGAAHFAWAIDFYEAGGNSDWLLPNRLYESIAFGAVPIAAAGVETARWLNQHGVGAVLSEPLGSATASYTKARGLRTRRQR